MWLGKNERADHLYQKEVASHIVSLAIEAHLLGNWRFCLVTQHFVLKDKCCILQNA